MLIMFWIIIAFSMAMYASGRGEYGLPYFLVSFALSPVAGWVILQMRMEIAHAATLRRLQVRMEMEAHKTRPVSRRYVIDQPLSASSY